MVLSRWVLALSFLAYACGDSEPQFGNAACEAGAEGCDCYGNNTCDEPLSCRSNLCVDASDNVNSGGGTHSGGGSGGDSGSAGGGSAPCDPGNYDFPGNGADEDCSGKEDDAAANCDSTVTDIADSVPLHAAQVLGLCRIAENGSWGVLDASYVMADGSDGMAPLSHGILPGYGILGPREGERLLALSSGTARRPGDPGYLPPTEGMMWSQSETPPGHPAQPTQCPNAPVTVAQAFDPAALQVTLRVPKNVWGLAFDFDFYSSDFADYVCSEFNDQFVTLMDPPPPGHVNGNISFDTNGDSVSVNGDFVDVCAAGFYADREFPCPQGIQQLDGTGFEGHSASGWRTTATPVLPGTEITLRFTIWDSGDQILDSTVLLDNLRWLGADAPTEPVTARTTP